MPSLLLALSLAACAPAPELDLGPAAEVGVPNPAPGAEPFPAETGAQLEAAWTARPADYVPRTRHLSFDGTPLYTNRLFLETSPYLRQHAHNPVDWHPWGEAAFALARRLGRPVLLSVGYSTCHWCHVMEEESFEDLEIARFLNEHYVAIKVDREERPDVDAVYMAAVQALTGRGGWPMTVWLTPDREPFMGGTYFPARDGDRGTRTGFLTVLRQLREAWDARRDEVVRDAARLASHVRAGLAPPAGGTIPGAEELDQLARRLDARYDAAHGGLAGAPKFPSHLPIRFLLRQHRRTGDARPLEMARHTLLAMARGGMRDHLGGGFHRYSTDERWLVPHFEEMLYDNALLAVAYTEAWQATGDPELAAVVRDVLRYLERDMSAPDGAFWSATDADSPVPGTDEREEGWSFTWTPDEMRAVLDEEHARVALAWYAVEPGGNFEGRSILHTPRPADAVAAREVGLPIETFLERVGEARDALYAARARRPPPLRDEKVIAAWNGLAISAFAKASVVFGEASWAARAVSAAESVLARLRVDGRLRRTFMDGVARHDGVLEDHAFLAAACLDLFEATSDRRWLAEALALDALIAAHFEDPQGGFFRTADDAEALLVRERPDHDGAEPSGASVHVLTLYRLAALTGSDDFRARADRALAVYGGLAARGAMSEMLLAVDWRLDRPKEVVIVTPSTRDEARPFLDELATAGVRNRVLVVVLEAEIPALAPAVPLVEGKVARDGRATAYVCEQGVCQLPITDPRALRRQL